MDSYFWWGKKVDNILFKGFCVNSNDGIFGICVIIGAMAFAFEYLRFLQSKHKQRELILRVKQLKLLCPTESAALLARTIVDRTNPLNITIFDRFRLFATEVSLWLLLQNLGYFLMLCIMIYNAWFLISAVIGGGLGYFVFGQMFMKINLQNCQIMRSAYCTQICGETDAITRDGHSTPVVQETPSTSSSNLDCHRRSPPKEEDVYVHCH